MFVPFFDGYLINVISIFVLNSTSLTKSHHYDPLFYRRLADALSPQNYDADPSLGLPQVPFWSTDGQSVEWETWMSRKLYEKCGTLSEGGEGKVRDISKGELLLALSRYITVSYYLST